ncbi:hypothetical protein [Enterovirga sp. CN4-39]|uniref:hypothetical protein n=1 Tax=Enterovirga sp. CN4-39 TaxID=3400910 RepID=UPI003C00A648
MEIFIDLRNRLSEERRLTERYGNDVGLGGGCEHPGYKRIGVTSKRTCGLWEAADEAGHDPEP